MSSYFSKLIKFIAAGILLPTLLLAQGLGLDQFQLELKSSTSQFTVPFKRILIVDKRFDSTKIGFANFDSDYKEILIGTSLAESLQSYFNTKNLSSSVNRDLVIFIKTFWLHEIKLGEITKEGVADEKKDISQSVLKADLYALTDGSYQALTRIDTVLESTKPLKKAAAELLSLTLDQILLKTQSLNIEQQLLHKKKISKEDVANYYDQRFNTSRIKNDTLQKGIYLTFNDFVNNRPASLDFRVDMEKEADYLYVKEKGEEKLMTDFWGFCDGKDHFIKIGYSFFLLQKDQNTYSFWGCLEPIHKRKEYPRAEIIAIDIALGNYPSNNRHVSKLKNILRPMQLDMESGIAY